MASQHILEIGKVAPKRPTILIRTEAKPEGTIHELRVGTELSPQELAEIVRMAEAMEAMGDGNDDLEASEIELLGTYLDRMLEVAFWKGTPMTEDERDTLTPEQKANIVEAFTKHCLEGRPAARQSARKATRRAKTPAGSTGGR